MTISPSLRKGTNIEERVPKMIESLFSLAESHASAFNFSDVEEWIKPVSYTHLRAHETKANLV